MSGMRRPNLSPSQPKMNAPIGRIISVSVIANVTLGMLCPKSWPIGTRTNVTRKKSSASSAQPRKQATNVFRCSRFKILKSLSASTVFVSPNCHVERSRDISKCFRNSKRFLPFDSLRSLRAGSQYGGCAAVKWMQRHASARNDKTKAQQL